MKTRIPAILLVVAIVVVVITISVYRPSAPEEILEDLSDIKPEDAGFNFSLVPTKDPKTGFIVAGKNATALIRDLTEINGKTIAELEDLMRPGAASTAGFLGFDEKLLDVLAADNQYVVEELGLTHQELAKHLDAMGDIFGVGVQSDTEFLYHGRKFKVKVVLYGGTQESPFGDGTETGGDMTVDNISNGKTLTYSGLMPDLIGRYGFYEGKGTRYRVDPRDIVELFDFLKEKTK